MNNFLKVFVRLFIILFLYHILFLDKVYSLPLDANTTLRPVLKFSTKLGGWQKGVARTERGKKLLAWAEEHRGETVDKTCQELATELHISYSYINKILKDYNITAKGGQGVAKTEEGEKLLTWAEAHRGETVNMTCPELAKQFDMSYTYVWKVLKNYDITAAKEPIRKDVGMSKKGEKLLAWAEAHQGETIDKTRQELAEQFGMSYGHTVKFLRKYDITAKEVIRHGRQRTKKGEKLLAWAEAHQGERVDKTRQELAEQFGMTYMYIWNLLKGYNIIPKEGSLGRHRSEKTEKLLAWVDKHRGEKIEKTQQEIIEQVGVGRSSVHRILKSHDIISPDGRGHTFTLQGKALVSWAETFKGQKVDTSVKELSERFGMSNSYTLQVLKCYNITTKRDTEDFYAWAKLHKGQRVDMTIVGAAQHFNSSRGTAYRIFKEYDIIPEDGVRRPTEIIFNTVVTRGQNGKLKLSFIPSSEEYLLSEESFRYEEIDTVEDILSEDNNTFERFLRRKFLHIESKDIIGLFDTIGFGSRASQILVSRVINREEFKDIGEKFDIKKQRVEQIKDAVINEIRDRVIENNRLIEIKIIGAINGDEEAIWYLRDYTETNFDLFLYRIENLGYDWEEIAEVLSIDSVYLLKEGQTSAYDSKYYFELRLFIDSVVAPFNKRKVAKGGSISWRDRIYFISTHLGGSEVTLFPLNYVDFDSGFVAYDSSGRKVCSYDKAKDKFSIYDILPKADKRGRLPVHSVTERVVRSKL